jgi:hypothetical protein
VQPPAVRPGTSAVYVLSDAMAVFTALMRGRARHWRYRKRVADRYFSTRYGARKPQSHLACRSCAHISASPELCS